MILRIRRRLGPWVFAVGQVVVWFTPGWIPTKRLADAIVALPLSPLVRISLLGLLRLPYWPAFALLRLSVWLHPNVYPDDVWNEEAWRWRGLL